MISGGEQSRLNPVKSEVNRPVFGDFIIYVDESGDHGLTSINPEHPVFVLAFCLFRVSSYVSEIVPAIQSIKFRHFGHDMVVLHEREIRKSLGSFSLLFNPLKRESFMSELASVIEQADFEIFAYVIDKEKFRKRGRDTDNPYSLALKFGLEAISAELLARNQAGKETFVIFESRGKREDFELKSEFKRIVERKSHCDKRIPLTFLAVDKKVNSSGLQIADMVARPIGIHALHPKQKNRAMEIILGKIHLGKMSHSEPQGLKIIS